MADSKPSGSAKMPEVGYKPPGQGNPALRMMGIRMPKKLPSRNWTIFLAITGSLSAAIIYDRREKDRATLKWAKSVAHLAKEPMPNASQLPRKLTVYLEAPPGDSLRIAQEHYKEFVKPILATSGLDWEFVQGREEGDIRAAVAERIRRARKREQGEVLEPTDADILRELRDNANMPQYEGIGGDIIIGRHTWKEYVRGIHEGWLGPLESPAEPAITPTPGVSKIEDVSAAASVPKNGEGISPSASTAVSKIEDEIAKEDARPEEEKKPEQEQPEETPSRPKQPPPLNKPEDYDAAELSSLTPNEIGPATTVPFPFMLGFLRTPKRVWRYIHRRELADQIGREVASAVLATHREFRSGSYGSELSRYEQEMELAKEEECWVKSVWKDKGGEPPKESRGSAPEATTEKIWTKPIVLDPRIAERMRRFQIEAEDEKRAKTQFVKEEEIEGFMKGSLRSFWRWGVSSFGPEEKKPPIPLEENGDDVD
ncbi:hypothetical protein MKZ38_000801 [Zalerion maritima]|uniref:Mitochondrial import inner membrane translocase subunit TIM54 n=1 Tax=Zalerion maritima TaxID=339359 RepID=A0AAD5RR21_9PEZI|nr:hypothetical protein MKZ38_000801 [Zalerion maritima]